MTGDFHAQKADLNTAMDGQRNDATKPARGTQVDLLAFLKGSPVSAALRAGPKGPVWDALKLLTNCHWGKASLMAFAFGMPAELIKQVPKGTEDVVLQECRRLFAQDFPHLDPANPPLMGFDSVTLEVCS